MDRYRDSRCFMVLCRIVYYFPIVLTMAILFWGEYSYSYQFCYKIVDNFSLRIFYLVVANTLLFFFLWAFWQTVIAPLGGVSNNFNIPQELKDRLQGVPDLASYNEIVENYLYEKNIPVSNRNFDGSVRYCIRCSILKPDRAHHCSTCDQCILKFDHHCPWVNTCINFRNYKFFVQFLCYGFSMCIFVFFSLLPYFIKFWYDKGDVTKSNRFNAISVLVLFIISGLFSISLGSLAFYHLYLISKNKTTNETFGPPRFIYGVDKNVYNLGCRRNFLEVFGSKPTLWFIPIFSSLGDGMIYPIKEDRNNHYRSRSIDDHVYSSSTGDGNDHSELLIGLDIV